MDNRNIIVVIEIRISHDDNSKKNHDNVECSFALFFYAFVKLLTYFPWEDYFTSETS